jgi:hypothetical protein
MPTTKRVAGKEEAQRAAGPVAGRPRMPAEYGVPKGNKGLLPWSHVDERMSQAKYYWICTVSPAGLPHATPVDGLWLDGRLYFGGSPETRRSRNLMTNPAVSVHLENALDVVILEGEARLGKPDHDTAVRLAAASFEKYGYGMSAEQYESSEAHIFRPRLVLAWQQFPQDVTRWKL